MTRLHRTAEVLLWCALVAFVGYGVGSCGTVSASEAAKREARAQEQGYRLAIAYMQERGAKIDTITRDVIRQGVRVDTVVVEVDRVLADTGATIQDLRRVASALRTEVVAYRVTVDSLIMSHLTYRQSVEATIVAADSTIAALKEVVEAGECRVLGVPCPSRWASFGGGFVAALALVLLL